jgi:branched-chain amino acid transport system ATP-binding protein
MTAEQTVTAPHLLSVDGLCAGYGKVTAIDDITIHVDAGEGVGIVGHNGAGKSTLLSAIFGTQQIWRGNLDFDGKRANNSPCSENIGRGMALLLADRYVFGSLTVLENLDIARSNAASGEIADRAMAKSRELFPRIWERRTQRADTLSGGERRMLGIAMVMMWEPRLLLLDEPSVGLAPALVERLFGALTVLREAGLAMLCVEQNIPALLRLVDRVYIIRTGRVVGEEKAATLAKRREYWDLVLWQRLWREGRLRHVLVVGPGKRRHQRFDVRPVRHRVRAHLFRYRAVPLRLRRLLRAGRGAGRLG